MSDITGAPIPAFCTYCSTIPCRCKTTSGTFTLDLNGAVLQRIAEALERIANQMEIK